MNGKILGLAAAATTLALTGVAEASRGTSVYNDNGGSVLRYVMRFEAARKPIRIMGACNSACTLALTFPGTCVGRGASLTFHAASQAGLTSWLMRNYPPGIRAWIRSEGGLTSEPITLKGYALHRLVKECRA